MTGPGNESRGQTQQHEHTRLRGGARSLGCRRFRRHISLCIITHPSGSSRVHLGRSCLPRSTLRACLGEKRLNKDPSRGRAEWHRGQGTAEIRWLREPEILDDDAECGWKRCEEEEAPCPGNRPRAPRRRPAQHRAERSRQIQSRASAAHRKLHTSKMKRSRRALMADQPGDAIYRGRRGHQPRTVAGKRVRSGNQRVAPHECGDGERNG